MADICTLALVTTLALCPPAQTCSAPDANGRIFCTPSLHAVNTCPAPPPTWDCRREDGTTYRIVGER